MSDNMEIQLKILDKVEATESRLGVIEVNMARNTESLDYHIKRTDDLQELVTPIYKQFLSTLAVEEHKAKERALLSYRLKLPAMIVSFIMAIGSIITWFMRS